MNASGEPRWIALWRRLGMKGEPAVVYRDLCARYAEPARAYHTLDHIQHCLDELDSFPGVIENRDAVEFALWFHDAVYDPKAKDNEERSAAWARDAAVGGALNGAFAARVTRLILATSHTAAPVQNDEQVLVDIDLSILGQSGETFDAYEQQIRAEYDWVPPEAFTAGRAAILRSFLARPRIYSTEFFFTKYESKARANLSKSIESLV